MSTTIEKRSETRVARLSKETNQLRRDVARADQLFNEGLARLQNDYKERLRVAIVGEDYAPEQTTAVGDETDRGDQVAS